MPGKVLIYIALILSAAIFAGSTVGMICLVDDGRIYSYSEESLHEELTDEQISSRTWNIADFAYRDDFVLYRETVEALDYIVKDETGKIILKSDGVNVNSKWEYEYSYKYNKDTKNGLPDGYENDERFSIEPKETDPDKLTVLTVYANVKKDSFLAKFLEIEGRLLHIVYGLRFAGFAIALAFMLLTVLLFIVLMCISGRRPEDDEVHPGPLNRIPFDIMLAAWMALIIASFVFFDGSGNGEIAAIFIAIFSALSLPGLCMSFVTRIKEHSLIKTSAVYRILRFLWKMLKKLCSAVKSFILSIPLVWKTVVGVGVFMIIQFIPIVFGAGISFIPFFVSAAVGVFIIYVAIMMKRLKKGGEALASGDLSYVVNTDKMLPDFKKHGNNLNSIAGGMTIAVEDRLKSERMKTELITNVSHDIKTPVTSIINYASLIGSETENEKTAEYAEVLVRQSEKLKKLVEDLVEVSKATTGNLEVNLAQCDASVFLNQASGEYDDKLKAAGLSLVVKEPNEEIRILADGRRMWRVFDNLMNNICKYALTGTNVYLSLEKAGTDARITFKNISREPLDISEEELMERFTRGDSSRNTEGNGLGLSIAKSMTELQGGTMKLSTDGDLFKVILTFPLA